MGPLLIPLLCAMAFAYVAWKRNRGEWAHPSRALSVLYLALALSSLVTPASAEPHLQSEPSWRTMLGYSALLSIALAPSLAIRRPPARAVVANPLIVPAARWAWAPVGFAFGYLVPPALETFQRGFSDTRELLNRYRGSPVPEGPLTTLAVAISMFYLCFAILAFASRARGLGSWTTAACAIGAGLAALHGSAFGARDGVLWAGFALLFAFWAMQPLSARLGGRGGRALAVLALVGAMAYLGTATRDRFAMKPGGYAGGTLMYFGAQPYVFEETVQRTTDYFGFALRFPLLASPNEYIERTEAYQWSFGTFLADFFGVGGWPYAVGLTLGGAGLVWFGLWASHGRSALAYLLVAGLYTQFMFQGAFYFRLGNRPGNIYHVLMFSGIGALVLFLPDRRSRPRDGRNGEFDSVRGLAVRVPPKKGPGRGSASAVRKASFEERDRPWEGATSGPAADRPRPRMSGLSDHERSGIR